jgi:hypothetical protein
MTLLRLAVAALASLAFLGLCAVTANLAHAGDPLPVPLSADCRLADDVAGLFPEIRVVA